MTTGIVCARVGDRLLGLDSAGRLIGIPDTFVVKAIRLYITSNNEPGTTYSGTVARFQVRTEIGGVDRCVGGIATAVSEFNATFPAAAAFDTNPATIWTTSDATFPAWLQYTFAAAIVPKEVVIQAGDNGSRAVRAPKNFLIQGSHDGVNWVTLGSFNATEWGISEARAFTLASA